MVNIWHPDRFEHNQRLKEKATEKLKIVNIAYDKLKDYQPPKSKPKQDTERRAGTSAQNGVNDDEDVTTDDISPKASITEPFKLSPITKFFTCIFLALFSLIAISILMVSFKNHTPVTTFGWGLIISVVVGIYFYLKVLRTGSKKVTAEDLAAHQVIRDETHLQVMECMIIFATIDGQIEDVDCILMDLIMTLGIDNSTANDMFKKAWDKVNNSTFAPANLIVTS